MLNAAAAESKQRKRQAHNVHTPRQTLRQLLLEQVDDGVVRWNSKVESFVEHDTGVCVTLADGALLRGTLLVGADGIFSSVRRCLRPDEPLNYLGVLVVLGITDASHELLRERVLQFVDGTTRIFLMPFTVRGPHSDRDRVMWQLSYPCERDEAVRLAQSPHLLRDDALRRCGAWHAPIPAMLAGTRDELITGTPGAARVSAAAVLAALTLPPAIASV